jgi:hypothetical protein
LKGGISKGIDFSLDQVSGNLHVHHNMIKNISSGNGGASTYVPGDFFTFIPHPLNPLLTINKGSDVVGLVVLVNAILDSNIISLPSSHLFLIFLDFFSLMTRKLMDSMEAFQGLKQTIKLKEGAPQQL